MSRVVVVSDQVDTIRLSLANVVMPALEDATQTVASVLRRYPLAREILLCSVAPTKVARWIAELAQRAPATTVISCRVEELPRWLTLIGGVQLGAEPDIRPVSRPKSAILRTDRQGLIRLWDAKAAGLFGRQAEQAVGRPIGDLVVEEQRHRLTTAWEESARTLGQSLLETDAKDPDGHRTRLRWHFAALEGESGEFVGSCVLVLDLSGEHRLVDQAELLSEHGGFGLFSTDRSTGEAYYSKAWKRMLGYEDSELENRHETFVKLLHPEDRRGVQQFRTGAVAASRQPFRSHFRMRHKDGSWRWILASGLAWIDVDRTVVRVTGVHLDVTELRQAQRMYGDLVHAFPGGMMAIVAPDLRVLTVGGAGWMDSGLDPALYPGRSLLELLPVHYRDTAVRFWREVFDGRAVYDETVMPSGRPVAYRGVPLRDEEGMIYAGLCVGIDVSEERRTIARLAEGERRYRLATAAGRVGCWEADPERRILIFDRVSGEIHRIQHSLPIHLDSFVLCLHEEDRSEATRLLQQAFSGQLREFSVEYRIPGADQTACWVDFRASGIRDEDGVLVRVMGTATDITARRLAEAHLRANEERYRILFECNPAPLLLCEQSGLRIIAANAAAIQMSGYPADSLIGRPFTALIEVTGRQVAENSIRSTSRTATAHGIFPLVRPSGELVSVELNSSTLPGADSQNWLILLNDRTENQIAYRRLRRNEARFRTLLAELPVGVALFDSDGQLRFANRIAREIAEANSAEWILRPELGGEAFHRLDNGEPLSPSQHPVGQAVDSGQPQHNIVVHKPSGSGPGCWLRVDAIPATSDADTRQVAMTVVDLSERYSAEAAMRRSLEENELLLKEVYHRVKNNLQVVASLVSMEARRRSMKSAEEALRDLGARITAMSLVHEQLYQARDLSRIDFGPYARTLATNLLRSLARRSSQIRLAVSSDAARLPLATAIPLGLILNELVANSLKHAFAGRDGGMLEILLQAVDDGHLRLSVTDDGIATETPAADAGTLGVRIVTTLAAQIRGVAVWSNRTGGGMVAQITFPEAPPER